MKKIIKVAALSVTALTLASTAFAADVNIYGASAQLNFWNDKAEHFLTAAPGTGDTGGMGCASAIRGYSDVKKTRGMTLGVNCSDAGGNDVAIRYTSNKSVEGPRSVANLDPQENDSCIVGDPTNDGLRLQADYVGGSFVDACLDVNAGCSDVASESFTQESHGFVNGVYDTTWFDEVLDPATIPGDDTLLSYQPVAVPFSFFANETLEVDHINRQQALLLFSGNVSNWNKFGSDYPNKRVVLCMRHAGSGTHATLDKAIMRADRSLPINQLVGSVAPSYLLPPFVPSPAIMFHTSSSNLMDCVDDNGMYATTAAGAIGYADSDKAIDRLTCLPGDDLAGLCGDATRGDEVIDPRYIKTKRLAYNGGGEGMNAANYTNYGYSALKNEIKNGSYEFWSNQWCYIDDVNEDAETLRVMAKMMKFAADPANMTCEPGIDERGCYWSAQTEINVTKEDDSTVPHF